MEKINKIRTFGCEYILVFYDNDSMYYSDESIEDIQKMLVEQNIEFDNYYYDINGGGKLTIDEMKEKFEDFGYEDEYIDEDRNVYCYTLELPTPVELDISESEIESRM